MEISKTMILCFHEVGYKKNEYAVTPEEFTKILKKYPKAEIHFDDGRKGILSYADRILDKMGRKATIFVVPTFVIGGAPPRERYSEFLSVEDLKTLIKTKRYYIGSHGYDHTSLIGRGNPYIYKQLVNSKLWIKQVLKFKTTAFSYPFGHIDPRIKKSAEKIYRKCYSLEDPLGIRRMLVYND